MLPFSEETIVSELNIWKLLSLFIQIRDKWKRGNSSQGAKRNFNMLLKGCVSNIWDELNVIWFCGRYLHHEGGNCQKSYFEVFSRAGSDWSLCKISTLTATPFMFFVHKYLIFDKYLTEIFSLNLWSVFQLSQTASDGFDWNWVKSGPLLFVIFQILNAMDRPIVQCLIQWS